jgi:mannose-6-phosphate isomerase
MSATRLVTRRVEKVWGRRDLGETFGRVPDDAEPVGEIWFEDPRPGEPALLVKYLFTSERLSIQVHPDDEAAREAGHRSGKDEAWVVLSADPDAVIGIGMRERMSGERLRAAALDGSIERLLDWRPAKGGDTYYSPAGTVHALGPGLGLIEVQQNVDVTYRLYDYGRPRELHLDEAVAVAEPAPYERPFLPYRLEDGREIVAAGAAFVLERWTRGAAGVLPGTADRPFWIVPVSGGGSIGEEGLEAGTAWLVDGEVRLALDEGCDILIAYPGAEVIEGLLA